MPDDNTVDTLHATQIQSQATCLELRDIYMRIILTNLHKQTQHQIYNTYKQY